MEKQAAGNSRRLKAQTLRLPPETWVKLKLLAATLDATRGTRVTQHDLLLEALNDLFHKYRSQFPGDGG